MARKRFPGKLFRFKSLKTSEQIKYAIDEIKNGHLYLSRPEDFNDSFDSLSILSYNTYSDYFKNYMNIHDPEYRKSVDELIHKIERIKGSELKSEEYLGVTRLYLDIVNVLLEHDENEASMKPIIENNVFYNRQMRQMRIACFTEQLKNMPMWAHYANSHRGICLQYDMTIESNMLRKDRFFKVKYEEQVFDAVYESIHHNRRLYDILEECVITKHKDWSYEKEWRLVYYPAHLFSCREDMPMNYHNSGILIDFIKPSSIYLGWKTTDELSDLISKAVEGTDVKIVKMTMTEYGLEEKLLVSEIQENLC